jgi:hypothetical protein
VSELGRVLSVDEHVEGSVAAATASIGGATITVEDPTPFPEEGGTLTHTDATEVDHDYTFTAADLETGVLTLSGTLAAAVALDDPVRLDPLAVTREAVVALEDADDAPILARVPHSLVSWFSPGVRSLEDQEAALVAERRPGDWVVTDVLGRAYASMGLDVTDIRNDDGVPLLGGDPRKGVPYAVFGLGTESVILRAENMGPVDASGSGALPVGGSGNLRKIGVGGIDTGGIDLTISAPVKLDITANVSVINQEATACNVRLYVLITEAVGSGSFPGRQATNHLLADNGTARHCQVVKSRVVSIDAAPDNERVFKVWWALAQDSAGGIDAFVRNLEMTIRMSYAPGLATATEPDREPQWGTSVGSDVTGQYQVAEGDDVI